MILLGASGLLQRIGRAERADFAPRFIEHVLGHHLDRRTGLLANVPGQDACNVGHGIEFVGFALEFLGRDCPGELGRTLAGVLGASFRQGFAGPGIALAVSIETGAALSPYQPWWSLPETIRAAALCYRITGEPEALAIWQAAHDAFFARYWRGEPPIAYQTLTVAGPVDYVPATPDLDPGYHTGLSLLGAIEAARG
jgi:mannose/cellobiose epimerase-like protein (N-acyl-D-glucosamine 2-epimerase family)